MSQETKSLMKKKFTRCEVMKMEEKKMIKEEIENELKRLDDIILYLTYPDWGGRKVEFVDGTVIMFSISDIEQMKQALQQLRDIDINEVLRKAEERLAEVTRELNRLREENQHLLLDLEERKRIITDEDKIKEWELLHNEIYILRKRLENFEH